MPTIATFPNANRSVPRGIRLDIPAEEWSKTGPEEAPELRLTYEGGITICGQALHLEAWAVDPNTERAVWVDMRDDLERLEAVASCRFGSVLIGGRSYVIITTPYAR